MQIIQNARKSILTFENKTWQKKTGLFDVAQGSYDGAEICEMVGLYILSQVEENFPELNFGLYRDDGLGLTNKASKTKMERLKKRMFKLFKKIGLKITIQTNMKIVDFLDITLNTDGTFKPYMKPNNTIKYVHRDSNHPNMIKKQIPKSVNKRLNTISSSQEQFENAKNEYQEALQKSGYTHKLKYDEKEKQTKKKKQRHKKVIWFNPPWSAEVKTNIGREFLLILDKHFPPKHRLRKYFNRHTVKVSYSTTENMQQEIINHNKKIISQKENDQTENDKCNCREPCDCPLNGKCKEECLVYKAELEDEETPVNYIGMTEGDFKARYNNHKSSFKNENKKDETTLSQTIWKLNKNPKPKIKWSILKKTKPYKPGSRLCNVCNWEIFFLLKAQKDKNNLNSRTELTGMCRHVNKHKLDKIR